MKKFSPRVALVYDRVNTPHGGAENVLLALHQAFPQAPLFTSVYDPQQAPWARIFDVKTSFLQKIPLAYRLHRWLPMLMPLAFESFDFSEYEVVISITSAEAKGVITQSHQLHLCYLLTPPRYLYQGRAHSLNSHFLLKLPGLRHLAALFLDYLTWWDQAAIQRPDRIVPISQRVARRIKKYYPNRPTKPVLYPPVEPSKKNRRKHKKINGLPKKFFLIVSRLVSYKHIDQAILACEQAVENLVIVGTGPEKKKLKKRARSSSNTTLFFENISENALATLYQQCQAVIMPGEEDFGIVALEANAYGKPVLINVKSGAAELIEHRVHGLHINSESQTEIFKTLKEYKSLSFSSRKIIHNPSKYGTSMFVTAFDRLVKKYWEKQQKEKP